MLPESRSIETVAALLVRQNSEGRYTQNKVSNGVESKYDDSLRDRADSLREAVVSRIYDAEHLGGKALIEGDQPVQIVRTRVRIIDRLHDSDDDGGKRWKIGK